MPNPPPRLTSGGMAPTSSASRARERERRALRLDDRLGVERLRPGKDVKPAPVRARGDDAFDQSRTPARHRRRTARRARPSASPTRAVRMSGLTRTASRGVIPSRLADRQRAIRLARGFEVDRHARLDRGLEFVLALARPGEADRRRRLARNRRHQFELALRRDVEAVDQRRHRCEQRRERIGLDRIMQVDRPATPRETARSAPATIANIVHEQRRVARVGDPSPRRLPPGNPQRRGSRNSAGIAPIGFMTSAPAVNAGAVELAVGVARQRRRARHSASAA